MIECERVGIKAAKLHQRDRYRIPERQRQGRARSRSQVMRTGFLIHKSVHPSVALSGDSRLGIATHADDPDTERL